MCEVNRGWLGLVMGMRRSVGLSTRLGGVVVGVVDGVCVVGASRRVALGVCVVATAME